MGRNKLDSRWDTGIFLGVRGGSGEIIVGTKLGVLKARSFRRKGSEDEIWDAKELSEMKGTPWEPILGRVGVQLKTAIQLHRAIR